jgi:hypothetical protein
MAERLRFLWPLVLWALLGAGAQEPPDTQLRRWAASYRELPGVAIGWVERHPGSPPRGPEETLVYEESLLGGVHGYLISTWRFPWVASMEREGMPAVALRLSTDHDRPERPSQISHPAGETLINTNGERQTFRDAGLRPYERSRGASLRRSDFVLATRLGDQSGELETAAIRASEDGGIAVTLAPSDATVYFVKVLDGLAIARIDVMGPTGQVEASFRFSEFRRFEGLPQPQGTVREMWSPDAATLLARPSPEQPLELQLVRRSELVFVRPLERVDPSVFRVSLTGLRPEAMVSERPSAPAANSASLSVPSPGSSPNSVSALTLLLIGVGVAFATIGATWLIMRARTR